MRKIIHIDMDCFYAAVEEKFHPEYRGKPLGVGGPANSRGVLCTANYEARKFGIKSAMPSSVAARKCPSLVLVRPNFPLYKQESHKVREIFSRFTDKIQPLSLDEAYLDVTDVADRYGGATAIARSIRESIQSELQLTASAGVAPNKFLAKIASEYRKPNGLFVLPPHSVESFMPSLKVEKIYGVGKVTSRRMHLNGHLTCGDLQKLSKLELARFYGNRAEEYFNLCRGIDDRPVSLREELKSLSVEETFNSDLANFSELQPKLCELYEDWMLRMGKRRCFDKIKSAFVKLRFSDFTATTCEKTFRGAPERRFFEDLCKQAWSRKALPIRLAGLGARLCSERQISSPQLTLEV